MNKYSDIGLVNIAFRRRRNKVNYVRLTLTIIVFLVTLVITVQIGQWREQEQFRQNWTAVLDKDLHSKR